MFNLTFIKIRNLSIQTEWGSPFLSFLIWLVKLTDPFQCGGGGWSLESRNPSTPEKPTCIHHSYSGFSSLSMIFSLRVFCVSFVYLRLFSVIWLCTLYYFVMLINFLGIYPQLLMLLLRNWNLTHYLSSSNTLPIPLNCLARLIWLHQGRVSLRMQSPPPSIRKKRKNYRSDGACGPSAQPIWRPHL